MSRKKAKLPQEGSIESRRPQPTRTAASVQRAPHRWLLPVFGILFGLLLCLDSNSSLKWAALLAALVGISLLLLRGRILRSRTTWLFLAVSVWVAVNGISTIYAVAPKFALYEFLKILISYGFFLTVLAFSRGEGSGLGRAAAAVLSVGASLVTFLSIDLISTRIFSGLFARLMSLFGADYADLVGIEPGIRMVSIAGNANVFAGCVGIGVLLSLGLAATAEGTSERRLHLCTLAINSLGFVLAFSMGASAVILLAFLAYLLLEVPQRRAPSLVLMVETLLVTLLATFPVYLTSFDAWDGVQPIPLLCMAASAAALCAIDTVIGQKLSARLAGLERGSFLLLGIVLAVLLVFAALALTLTGSATLGAGETLRRSAYPAAGDYTLSLEADTGVKVTIESQNRQDTMMHTSTVLYSGAADGAAFTVPEDSIVVYFTFSAPDGATLSAARYDGEESGTLKLEYTLLPGFIANRLQGLRANQNAIQRTVFFEDGMKLFRMSPVFGRGLGAFENGCFSVQSFYYETKYVHNHYIQALLDTGIVGLLCFLAVLGLSAWSVLASRRREDCHPLTAALGAALVFMAGHAAVEVVFSATFYLPMAFGAFALICLCCAPALPMPPMKEAAKRWSHRVCAALLSVYAVLLLGNLYAALLNQQPSYESLAKGVRVDRFEWADHALSYVFSAYSEEPLDDARLAQAQKYLPRLESAESNTIPFYLSECYFRVGQPADAFRMLEQYTAYCSANPQTWRKAFQLALVYYGDDPICRDGLSSLYQSMQDWNTANMGEIALDDSIMEVLEALDLSSLG